MSKECAKADAASALKARLEDALEHVRDHAIFMLDVARCVVSWNVGAQHVLGYMPDEIVGSTADVVFTPEDRARGAPAEEAEIATRDGRAEDERWHIRRDGSRFFGSGIMTAVRDDAGELIGFVKILRDFTHRRLAAQALTESEERYRLLIDSIKDYAIFMLDAAGHVIYWTAAAERIKGYTADEVTGQHFRIFFTPEDRGRGEPERELEEARLNGRAERQGWRCRRDGSCFWGEETATAVYDRFGGLQAYSKITRDATERMLADAERERLLRQATEANRIKDEFLSTVSHELRTPLNAVLGWTQLIREGRLSPEASKRAIETIERNARSQAALIADLLDVSRVVTGQIRLTIEPTPVVGAIMAAVESVKPAADAKHLTLVVDAEPEVGAVLGDPARLQQVIWNLLANAVKFTPNGGRVGVEARRDGHVLEIAVTDTGIGIDAGFLPFVFDRFRQADSSTTRTQPGLGLGLAIVKHLVELQGGTVAAESPGLERGATFRIRLPALEGGQEPELERRAEDRRHGAGGHRLDGFKIVAVDDDADARELVATALSDAGAHVTITASVKEALLAVQRDRPDLVLADLAMPGEDGYILIHKLRQSDDLALRRIPAVALTAYVRREDRQRLLDAGYQAHLAKPIELRELVETAIALLGARKTS
jgi:PAS domain S-box-containing protein